MAWIVFPFAAMILAAFGLAIGALISGWSDIIGWSINNG